jgi:segregation and condensation protein B
MSIKAKIEAIIYAAEEPVTLEQIFGLIKEEVRQSLTRDLETASSQPPYAEEAAAAPELPADATPEIASGEPSVPPVMEASQEPRQITDAEVKSAIRAALEELATSYSTAEHGIEVRQIAGGYRMATKPEQHDTVRAFAKSLKPPMRLTLQALETLAVIAYKQPITAPEIGEIRGVDSGGVVGTLLDRKLITTSGRKQVIGRPILYKTTKEFLLRFGLKDLNELPSVEEFEKLAAESLGSDLFSTAPETQPSETAGGVEQSASEAQAAEAANIGEDTEKIE